MSQAVCFPASNERRPSSRYIMFSEVSCVREGGLLVLRVASCEVALALTSSPGSRDGGNLENSNKSFFRHLLSSSESEGFSRKLVSIVSFGVFYCFLAFFTGGGFSGDLGFQTRAFPH